MVITIKSTTPKNELDTLLNSFQNLGIKTQIITGDTVDVVGLVGDTSQIDKESLKIYPWIISVTKISTPYKRVSRMFHPNDTIVDVNGIKIGGKEKIVVMAGPCAVENKDQIETIAEGVKSSGATMLRGGAYKPRTSPYSFQGLRSKGIELLSETRNKTGLPIVTEIMSADKIDEFIENVDIIQVGARNMQNFELLKVLGQTKKPILLKRGLANKIEEWLMSAEYIMAEGNPNVILCERGIRTFETMTRNTLDLSVIPLVKRLSHLPIVIDPSHATGHRELVESMTLAAIAAGADGLIIEVHNNPSAAVSDGAQSLTLEQFDSLMKKGKGIAKIIGRDI